MKVVGSLKVNDGNEGVGKVLISDADGVAQWDTLTFTSDTLDLISDVDEDTKIEVEASPDADTILFTVDGAEAMVIDNTGRVGIGTISPVTDLHVYGGNFRLDRGASESFLTRMLTIGGARNGSTNPYAIINFQNIDNNDLNVDHIGASISSHNANTDGSGDLRFTTFDGMVDSTRMIVDYTGKVGIGTISPDTRLSVIGNVRGAFDDAELEYTEISHGGGNGYINTVGDGRLDFRHDGSNYMSLLDNGHLGIGTTTPGHPLEMGSGAHVTAGGVWTNASDLARKEDLVNLKYGLAEILILQPRTYTYRSDGSKSIGFVAQEMEGVIPEVVSGAEGNKGIAYGLLTAVLVNGMQEQQEQIADLRNENDQMKSELESLRHEVAQLKGAIEAFDKEN